MLKKLFHIGSVSPAEGADKNLLLRVGEKHCAFAITDTEGGNLHELAYYSTDDPDENPVSALLEQHPELAAAFQKVLVSYDYPQSTFVPVEYYKHEEAGLLLKATYGVNNNTMIISEPVEEWSVNNIYAVPKTLHQWLNSRFPVTRYWHQHTLSAKYIQEADGNGHLLVDFRADDFTIQAAANGKLLLTQTFLYATPADVLYYLLKACQQFNLSQQSVHLSLSGLIDQESALYKELYQYFIHLDFRPAGWTQPDNEYPDHFFTTLNDLARCAS